MAKPPILLIQGTTLVANHYTDQNGYTWSAIKLIEQSKKYKFFKLPLAGIDISVLPWEIKSIDDIIHHAKRINNANLEYPIILDDQGIIADGWHRVSKAILDGRRTIDAIRLEEMPPIDRKEENKDT